MSPGNSVSQANRRASHRRLPRGSVNIEVRRGSLGLGKNIAAMFLDLSEGGARVVVKEELKNDDAVEVVLEGFGMKKPIKSTARVCWAMRLDNGLFCVGVSFDKRLPYREVSLLFKP
jgi:hypothetical protein